MTGAMSRRSFGRSASVAGLLLGLAAGGGSHVLALPLTLAPAQAGRPSSGDRGVSLAFDVSGSTVTVILKNALTRGSAASEALAASFSATVTAQTTVAQSLAVAEGRHESASCEAIRGWAWTPREPETAVAVDVYADESLLTTVTAGQFRRDLRDAGKGSGYHAFVWRLPPSLKDGQPHRIAVKMAGTGVDLVSTPMEIICSPASAP
jgi:hypothetical protein